MANYFQLEALLVARLESALGTDTQVFTQPDLQSVVDAGDRLPSVYVVHGQDVVTEGRSYDADAAITDQAWLVAIKVRHGADTAQSARLEAGTLIDTVLTALGGYQLDTSAAGPLRRVTAPRDIYDGAGMLIYPLQFLVRLY